MSDEITGFNMKDIVSWGNWGMICLHGTSQTIVKSPHGEENQDVITIERKIYERLGEHGGHEGLLHCYQPYESGIRLEFASNGHFSSFLEAHKKGIDIERRLYWAKQIAAILHYVHSRDVVHGV